GSLTPASPMYIARGSGKYEGRYSQHGNGNEDDAELSCCLRAGRRQIPKGHATAPRPDHPSQTNVRRAPSFCPHCSSLPQNNSSIAFLNEKRRHAVPWPGCRLGGPSTRPKRSSSLASGAPCETQTNT